MEIWAVLTTLFLLLAFIALVVLTYMKDSSNEKMKELGKLRPFIAKLDPTDPSKPVDLVGMDSNGNKVPQISCPVGSHVSIVGAWYEIFDPYAECNPNGPSAVFSTGCGSDDSTSPQCQFLTSSKQNAICSPKGPNYPSKFDCRPRDASAYLASVCDGHNSCPVSIGGGSGAFGPSPCRGIEIPSIDCTATSGGKYPNRDDDNPYCQLPFIPGWAGGAPSDSSSAISIPGDTSMGYYVHGIYACIPDDE